MSNPRPYLTTLTPLRGIAALVVVIYHCNLVQQFMSFEQKNFIIVGWLWVDFFFVLSGFILAYVYGEGFKNSTTSESYWKYIKARFARVYPLHFVTTIWCLIFAIVILQYVNGLHPANADSFDPMGAIPSLFFAQVFGTYIFIPLNAPSWSLATEWWMYMLFPFLVPAFYRLNRIGKVAAAIGIAALYVFVKFYFGPKAQPFPGQAPTLDIFVDYGIFRCMAGFLLGMLLFRIYDESAGIRFFGKSWVFVFFFAATMIAMQTGAEQLLIVALFPFVILAAAYNQTGIKRFLDTPLLQRLGDWSFSIYMVHVPVLYLVMLWQVIKDPSIFREFPSIATPDYTIGIWVCIIVVPVTLITASFTYKYVEVPARNYLNRKFGDRKLASVKLTDGA